MVNIYKGTKDGGRYWDPSLKLARAVLELETAFHDHIPSNRGAAKGGGRGKQCKAGKRVLMGGGGPQRKSEVAVPSTGCPSRRQGGEVRIKKKD